MAAVKDLGSKIRRVLSRRMNGNAGVGAKVRVERRERRGHLDVTVVSRNFSGRTWIQRGKAIWKWFDEELTFAERLKIVGLIALTPSEERRRHRERG
jgi:stress-induced morphogen